MLVDRPSILLEILDKILHVSGLAQPAPGARDAIERIASGEPCLLELVLPRIGDAGDGRVQDLAVLLRLQLSSGKM